MEATNIIDLEPLQVGSGGLPKPDIIGLPGESASGSNPSLFFRVFIDVPPMHTAGSGGSLLLDRLWMKRTTGGAVLSPHAPVYVVVKDKERVVVSIEEELNAIRQYLGLNISDTAQVLLVKRPTIYEWLAGTLPRPNNMRRIENVYEIAREWHALSPHPATRYLHHRVFNKKSLIKLLAEDPLDKSVIGETMRLISIQLAKDRQDRRSISDIAREHGFKRPSEADQASALRRISAPISDAED